MILSHYGRVSSIKRYGNIKSFENIVHVIVLKPRINISFFIFTTIF